MSRGTSSQPPGIISYHPVEAVSLPPDHLTAMREAQFKRYNIMSFISFILSNLGVAGTYEPDPG